MASPFSGSEFKSHKLAALSAYDWVILILIAPVLIFISPGLSFFLLFIPLLWFWRKWAVGHFVPQTPLDWGILGLLIMALVSIFVTFDIAFSLPKIAGLLLGVAVFYTMVSATGRSFRALWYGVGALLVCGLGVAALGLFGTAWGHGIVPVLDTLTNRLPAQGIGFFGPGSGFHPNQVGGTLLWVTPLAMALFISAVYCYFRARETLPGLSRFLPILLGATSMIFLGVIVLTQSRAAWFGLANGLVLMLLLAVRRKRWLFILSWVGIIIVLLLLMGTLNTESATYLLFPRQDEVLGDVLSTDTLEGRLSIWQRALYGMRDFPITGMGFGAFREVVDVLYPFFPRSPSDDIGHAHNQFFQVTLDLGIPGLIAFIFIWMMTLFMLWKTWQKAEGIWSRTLVIGCSGSVFAFFIYSLIDTVALGTKPGFIFWMLLGVVAGHYRLVVGFPAGAKSRQLFLGKRPAIIGGSVLIILVLIFTWTTWSNYLWNNLGSIQLVKQIVPQGTPLQAAELDQSRAYFERVGRATFPGRDENLLKVNLLQENWPASEQNLIDLKQQMPEQTIAMQWVARTGESLLAEERLPEAEQVLQLGLDLQPENEKYWVYRFLAETAEGLGKIEEATTFFAKAYDTAPGSALAGRMLTRLARIHYDAGDLAQALPMLVQSADLDPEYNLTFRLLGEIYLVQDRPDAARQAYEHLLDLEPNNRAALRALEEITARENQD